MSEIAILGDTHFGARGGSIAHINHMQMFYDKIFFPTLKKRGITKVFQLGDLLDQRKSINFYILNRMKKMFLDRLRDEGIEFHVLIGNHDIYYRESLEINGVRELFSHYPNIKIYEKPTTIEIDEKKIDIVPWICEENLSEIQTFIETSKSDVILGHFEISNTEMFKGTLSTHGIDRGFFSNYKKVFSGHYHTRSINGNVQYLGTPYEITWSDCDDDKGFGILNCSDLEMEFIQNTNRLFRKFAYDDSCVDYSNFDLSEFVGCYLKLIVVKRTNEKMFDEFIDRIYQECKPQDLQISDVSLVLSNSVVADCVDVQDPLVILMNSISSENEDADQIKNMIHEIWIESMSRSSME